MNNTKTNPNFNPIGSYDNADKYNKFTKSLVKNTLVGNFANNMMNSGNNNNMHRNEEDTSYNYNPQNDNNEMRKNVFPNKNTGNLNYNPNTNMLSSDFNNNLGYSSVNMNSLNMNNVNTNSMNTLQHNKLSNSMVHAPQKLSMSEKNPMLLNQNQKNMSQEYNSLSNNKFIDFIYEYDFDENGVFYYLGCMGKTAIYKNPHDIGQIKVFASSLGRGRLADFIGREIVNLRTLNEPFSFFGVDLGEDRTLIPNSYSIWNRNSSSHVMLGWQLEASNDRVNFNVIDTRVFISTDPRINNEMEKERNLLKIPGCTSTWGVDPQVAEKFPNGFRFFILKQIIKNSSGAYNMAISSFEIYGRGLGKRWSFR